MIEIENVVINIIIWYSDKEIIFMKIKLKDANAHD